MTGMPSLQGPMKRCSGVLPIEQWRDDRNKVARRHQVIDVVSTRTLEQRSKQS
jgi:hypothetical protein